MYRASEFMRENENYLISRGVKKHVSKQRTASSAVFCDFYLLPVCCLHWSPHQHNNLVLFCLAMQHLIRSKLKVAWLQSLLCYLVLRCKQNHIQCITFLRGFFRELCGTCNCPHKQIIN